jgi:hypothetical protein
MAVIERIGRAGTRPYIMAWGRLTEHDESRLRLRLDEPSYVEATIDLREIEEVTEEGCEALLNIADYIGERGQRMVVLYLPDRDGTGWLERTGIVRDPRIVFVDSSVHDQASPG